MLEGGTRGVTFNIQKVGPRQSLIYINSVVPGIGAALVS
jgi:hypothetical protein